MTDNIKDAAKKLHLSVSELEAYLEQQAAKTDAGKPELTVYDYRDRGREYCRTEGSDHYILSGVEPMDLIISCGYAEHFCLGSIIKYAVRFGESGNPEDLKKIADYAHILAGLELADNSDRVHWEPRDAMGEKEQRIRILERALERAAKRAREQAANLEPGKP